MTVAQTFDALHRLWVGRLTIYPETGKVIHEEHRSEGIYVKIDNILAISWNTFPAERFVICNGSLLIEEGLFSKISDHSSSGQADLDAAEYIFVTSHTHKNALVRLQSAPVHKGLLACGCRTTWVHPSSIGGEISTGARVVVVHYNDPLAIRAVHNLSNRNQLKVICLSSDVYNIDDYVYISDYVDAFIAPTKYHADLLRSALGRAVFVIPEGVDPIATSGVGAVIPVRQTGRICWFGYPESFHKSFRLLMGCLSTDIAPGRISLITEPNVSLIDGFDHLDFDIASFYAITADFEYSLLSHFAFDGQINTFIKSPNKFVTSIVRGLTPVASRTPNYKSLAEEFGLHRWVYGSPRELSAILKRITDGDKIDATHMGSISAELQERFSPLRLAALFLNIAENYLS